jgi:chaperonin GroES
MTRKLQPIGERVLVRRDGPTTITDSGLHIPSTAQGKTMRGEVLAVGSRVEQVTDGDRVLFSKTSGVDCELDGEKYLMLRENDIIGILD